MTTNTVSLLEPCHGKMKCAWTALTWDKQFLTLPNLIGCRLITGDGVSFELWPVAETAPLWLQIYVDMNNRCWQQ